MDCSNKHTSSISTCFLVLPVAFPFDDSRKQHSSSFGCHFFCRLQNSPYICEFRDTRAVKQKVWNEAENSKTLTPRFTNFFTDFEKKTRLFCSLLFLPSPKGFHLRELSLTNIFTRTVKAMKCLHTKGNVYSILRLIKYDFFHFICTFVFWKFHCTITSVGFISRQAQAHTPTCSMGFLQALY